MMLTHLAASILIQAQLFSILIWYYDTDLKAYVIISLQCIAVLIVDYLINGFAFRKTNLLIKRNAWFHLGDSVLAFPSIFCISATVVSKTLDPKHSLESSYVIASFVVLAIEALVFTERFALIKQK